jgi:NADPH-dependent glutamate synthase beta subunit-like oxidoreductase/dihydroorotate dehydrogenase/Pyruvate/2-oxoacid:ferredoxin oxidoreductase delta subunit
MKHADGSLTDAQFRAELERCIYCEEKPCQEACPADCSPADFIMAARVGEKSDLRRSAAMIMSANPLGWVCGVVCPDYFCMKACSRRTFDRAIEIPAVQATVVQKANEVGMAKFKCAKPNGKIVGIIGAGPAGFGAASVLAQRGYQVTVYEQQRRLGGAMNLIPDFRLNKRVVRADIEFLKSLGDVEFKTGVSATVAAGILPAVEPGFQPGGKSVARSPRVKLLCVRPRSKTPAATTFDAVIVCAGLSEPIKLNIPGEELALSWEAFLENQKKLKLKGRIVAVLGGGAVAADCATTARRLGAASVELVYRRRQQDMPLTQYERDLLLEHGVEITSCSKPLAIVHEGKRVTGLRIARMTLPAGKESRPENFVVSKKESPIFREFDLVISAIGSKPKLPVTTTKGVFYAGDMVLGAGTVVESVASGKNAALEADAFIHGEARPKFKNRAKSYAVLAGTPFCPVPLDADFFGRRILSPFLISAAPHTDGYAQMRKAYERGWSGGVMKTAFDNVPIHIPAGYMFALTRSTYGNCDNVSGHPLGRVCREVGQLVKEFPDRLTLASTGGPVSGRDAEDKAVWQSNTRKLQNAGAMGVEYSLSCPQGGDGTHGDVVSQNAELTAKIIDWVMEASTDDNPKLFKLTAAVTAIQPIIKAIQEVFARHPNKKAGVTLANSFPSLAFRASAKPLISTGLQPGESERDDLRAAVAASAQREKPLKRLASSAPHSTGLKPGANESLELQRRWEEGVVIGMSGEGVLPISNLTLAKVASTGITVSGNGGAMTYKDAANFLALGAHTVQFCTAVMKYGLGYVDELHSGLSYLMEERGFRSVKELIGSALPNPITDFGSLSPTKKLPQVVAALCEHCGNCERCPYQAIVLNGRGVPVFDPSHCVGCSLCAQKCFAGAISMRERTKAELVALNET